MIALASIVLPFGAARIRDATRAELTDQIEAAIWSARAIAQREAAPVRVLVDQDSDGARIVAEVVRPSSPERRTVNETRDEHPPLPLANLGEARFSLSPSASQQTLPASDTVTSSRILIALALPTDVCVSQQTLLVRVADEPEQHLRIDPASFEAMLSPRTAAEDDSEHSPPPLPSPTRSAGSKVTP